MVHRALAKAEKCSPTQEKHSLEISLEQIDLSAAKQVETTGGRGPTLVVFGAGIADHIVVAASLFHRGASAVHIPSPLMPRSLAAPYFLPSVSWSSNHYTHRRPALRHG